MGATESDGEGETWDENECNQFTLSSPLHLPFSDIDDSEEMGLRKKKPFFISLLLGQEKDLIVYAYVILLVSFFLIICKSVTYHDESFIENYVFHNSLYRHI